MSGYQERLRIHDICKDFEWEHRPEVLICVEPGFTKGRWFVHMGATGFSSDGKFSKEATREIIFSRSSLKETVWNELNAMYRELYGK